MMNNYDFYVAVGYFSNPIRQTKLDAEVPIKDVLNFESKYRELTAVTPQPDNQNYYILHKDADKWGVELRIYFIASDIIPHTLKKMIVKPRPDTKYTHRINDNRFIWKLVQAGFLLGDVQNEKRIRNIIPNKYLNSFNKGFRIC